MKRQFLYRLLGSFLFLLLVSSSFAQKDTTFTALPSITITSKTTNVSAKLSKAFESTFKGAENPTWYKVSKNYLAEFIMKDMKNKALFPKNGKLIYHIDYGSEKNLPDDVRKTVKSNYGNYNITTAINVKEADTNVWVVNLEDNKNLVVVRVADGGLEEIYNYSKTKL